MTDVMSCERFDSRLADLLEGEVDATTRAAMESHAARCEACGPLAAGLRRLTSEAAALPPLRPSRDLWDGIEARIATPVVLLTPGREDAHPVPVSHPIVDRRLAPLAAAAAILIAATAGITHLATRRAYESADTVVSATAVTGPVARRAASASAPVIDPPSAAGPGATLVSRAGESADVYQRAERAALAVARTTATVAGAGYPQRRIIDSTYAAEIGQVERVLRSRRRELDPATVEIVERNLRLIDGAIRESRAALARDPGSAFLNEELTGALHQKLELLRIAATLPSRS